MIGMDHYEANSDLIEIWRVNKGLSSKKVKQQHVLSDHCIRRRFLI